ncbi:uncharacterized protein LOC110154362 isoform X2 [Boleophthalmus pectinirostris]|uniref:uncharacterized protein LOC110154362 isoform X2 n=1 Tax=Boleophthalmus pectinirostris TaxID=150288 RepID=UPI00242FF438|nr:uncharacterized protein LOC110154362 isoform X2 [Boleophthalmus pectinirostris]
MAAQSPLSSLYLHAIVTLLYTGAVKLQSSNYSELLFNLTNETVTTVSNATTLNLTWTDEDFHHIQEDSNVTLITEDDEGFQDWDTLPLGQCHKGLLHEFSHVNCAQNFHEIMKSVSEDKWCSLPDIIRDRQLEKLLNRKVTIPKDLIMR